MQASGDSLKTPTTVRGVPLAILGAVALVLKPAYHGPFGGLVLAYGGNCAVSFALYFAAMNTTSTYRSPRLVAASATLLAVEAFEITNGFGVMANVYNSVDLVANAAGVVFAVVVDVATSRLLLRQQRVGDTSSAFTEPADAADSAPREVDSGSA